VAAVARLEPLTAPKPRSRRWSRAPTHRADGRPAGRRSEEIAACACDQADVRHEQEQRQDAEFEARDGFEEHHTALDERRLDA
jgi:hypothetical protein